MNVTTKFSGNSLITDDIDIFQKFNMAAAAILDFRDKWLSLARSAMTVVVPWAVYQIWFKYNRWERHTRRMTSCRLTSGSVFGHVGISAWSLCFFVPNCIQIFSGTELLALYEMQWPLFRHVWFVEESRGRHMKAHSKNFVMKVLFTGPEFQLLRNWLPKFTGWAKLNGASLHFCLWQYHLLIRMTCAVTECDAIALVTARTRQAVGA